MTERQAGLELTETNLIWRITSDALATL